MGEEGERERTDNVGYKVELEKVCDADVASPDVEDAGHEAQADV